MGEAKAKEQQRQAAQLVHYNIAEAEASMRAQLAGTIAQGLSAVAEGRADAWFIAAQRQFDEARIQFVLGGMRATNEGVPRDEMLTAAGMAMGLMMAGLTKVCIGNRERGIVNAASTQAFEDAMRPAPEEVRIEPMQGGTA